MIFKNVVENISTLTDLKRVSSAYVIDYRNLTNQEIAEALIKTSPQYYFRENVIKTLNELSLSHDRKERIIAPIILRHILLHTDDFKILQSDLSNLVIEYEQSIINTANDSVDSKIVGKEKSYELFKYVLEAAWEHNDNISSDEKNLLEKIRERLNLSLKEYHVLEASIGKFPQPNNKIHSRDQVEQVRRKLQSAGLLFTVRDEDKNDYDVIPDEIASVLNEFMGIEMREHGYRELIEYKALRNKSYLSAVIQKGGIEILKSTKLEEMKEICIENIKPSILLGGYSPRDGLDSTTLSKWCSEIGASCSGQKNILIDRVIEHYNNIRADIVEIDDERKLWFEFYEDLAQRSLDSLRAQNIILKDIECEKKFEQATDYIFEELLFNKPLMLKGTEHADGMLAFQDKVILWDNKSKETDVNLLDHIKQFDRYIKNSEKQVPIFIVIGPAFTEQSVGIAMEYMIENDTMILLMTAKELKDLATEWSKNTGSKKEPFLLGYFKQPGRFNRNLVKL
jgi:hypothetical protein